MKQQSQLLKTLILNLFFKATESEILKILTKENSFGFGLFPSKTFLRQCVVRSSGFQSEVPPM